MKGATLYRDLEAKFRGIADAAGKAADMMEKEIRTKEDKEELSEAVKDFLCKLADMQAECSQDET